MALGGCTSARASMPASDACQYIRNLVAEHVKLEENPEVVQALHSIHLAINENDNLHTDIGEMTRIIADLNKQLEARCQVVFS